MYKVYVNVNVNINVYIKFKLDHHWLTDKLSRYKVNVNVNVNINLRKPNSENVSNPKVGVLSIEFTCKLRIYRSLKSLTCLKWIRKKFSTTLHTQFNYLSLPVTPFNINNTIIININIDISPFTNFQQV